MSTNDPTERPPDSVDPAPPPEDPVLGVPVVHPPSAEEPVDDRPEFKPDASDLPPHHEVSDPYTPPAQQQPAAPPAQQPYQQPPPQQWQGAPASSDGLDPKVGGLLAYLLGWIGGLVIYLTQKNPEVRFHGAQSVLFNIAMVVVWIAYMILAFILPSFLDFLLWIAVLIGGFGLWVLLCVKGYAQEHFKLPVIGDIAEQWASK